MPFNLRGHSLKPMFNLSCEGQREDSLFGIIKKVDPGGAFTYIDRKLHEHIQSAGRNGYVTTRGCSRYVSLLAVFDEIIYNLDEDLGDELDDDQIMAGVYEAGQGNWVNRIAGGDCGSSAAFIRKFHAAIDSAAPFFQVGLPTLANQSFAATYEYKDVAALLARTGAALDTKIANQRVFETAYIMNRIINKGRCIAASILLNQMHVDRFRSYTATSPTRPYYNHGSVLYTLLTFSYLVAENHSTSSAYDETKWYFFWKMFGSLLGLHRYVLADTHAQADGLWRDFTNDQGLVGTTSNSQRLNNAFNLEESTYELVKFGLSLKSQYFAQRLFWKTPGMSALWKLSEYMTKNRIG